MAGARSAKRRWLTSRGSSSKPASTRWHSWKNSYKHKEDIDHVFGGENGNFGNVDYIGCWFILAARSLSHYRKGMFAFVSTTSLFQGEQAEIALHILANYGLTIAWAHASFPWSNNAANNAGVICCIVGCAKAGDTTSKFVYENGSRRKVPNIGPYLVPMPDMVVTKQTKPLSGLRAMSYGSMSNDDGIFTVPDAEYRALVNENPDNRRLMKIAVGGAEFIKGIVRRSIYVRDESDISPEQVSRLSDKFERVRRYRAASNRAATRKLSDASMFFAERRHFEKPKIFVPQVLSERREYITVGFLAADALVIAPHMQIVDGQLFEFAILSSKMHHTWVSTVCGRLKSDIRYSNLLGWNTFPIPTLTDKNKADLTRTAQDILIARETQFPTTIAELYDPERMPDDLR